MKDKGRYEDERERKEGKNRESKRKGLNEEESRKASNRPFFATGPDVEPAQRKRSLALSHPMYFESRNSSSSLFFPTFSSSLFIESFVYHINIPMSKDFVQIKLFKREHPVALYRTKFNNSQTFQNSSGINKNYNQNCHLKNEKQIAEKHKYNSILS